MDTQKPEQESCNDTHYSEKKGNSIQERAIIINNINTENFTYSKSIFT